MSEKPQPNYDYSQYDEAPSEDGLAILTRLAARMADEMAEVARVESELKEAKQMLRRTQEEDIPNQMDLLSIKDFTTKSGLTIKVKEDVFGSLPRDAALRAEALTWIVDHDYGSLIKDSFSLKFGKGDKEVADKLAKLLEDGNFRYDRKEDIHASTLKAFIRELMRDGEEVPFDLLGVRERRFAVIK